MAKEQCSTDSRCTGVGDIYCAGKAYVKCAEFEIGPSNEHCVHVKGKTVIKHTFYCTFMCV